MYVEEFAPAKLNVRLKLMGRRTDGYHLLSMLNCTLAYGDSVRVQLGERGGEISLNTSFDGVAATCLAESDRRIIADPGQNIVVKAAQAYRQMLGLGRSIQIELTKRLPAGGGLGGGSSDAAAVLRALAKLCPDSDLPRLTELGLRLGADVPYFLCGGWCAVSGVGEKVVPCKARPGVRIGVTVIVPPYQSSTPEVYAAARKRYPNLPEHPNDLVRYPDQLTYKTICEYRENDLEELVIEREPRLGELLGKLRRALPCAGMSGSGSCCFALYEQADTERCIPILESIAQAHGAVCIHTFA